MAANKDVMYAESVRGLNLQTVSRYVAYALTDIVKGLVNKSDGRQTIIHKPFELVQKKCIVTNTVSIVYPTDYLNLCTSEDPIEFMMRHRHSDNYIHRVLALTLQSLIATGLIKHFSFFKVVNKITDAPGTISYIIGYDFEGYEDMTALKQDWFLFTQTRRTMDM